MNKTTIQISQEILERLKMIKRYKRESYEEVLTNLLDEYEEETLSDGEIEDIKVEMFCIKRILIRHLANKQTNSPILWVKSKRGG